MDSFLALLTLSSCFLPSLAQSDATTCTTTFTPAIDITGLSCAKHGVLSSPSLIKRFTPTSRDNTACRTACFIDSTCLSFSYNSVTNKCQTFSKSMSEQRLQKKKLPRTFWDKDCFEATQDCPSDSSDGSGDGKTGTTDPVYVDPAYTGDLNFLPETPPLTLPVFTDAPTEPADGYGTSDVVGNPPCLADADDAGLAFNLLSSVFTPFVIRGTDVALLTAADFPGTSEEANAAYEPPVFRFEKPAGGTDGYYDIVYQPTNGDKVYLARQTDGTVTTVSGSSNGPSEAEIDGSSVITTLFTVSCEGKLRVASMDEVFIWAVTETGSMMNTGDDTSDTQTLLYPLSLVASAKVKRGNQYQSGYQPRCPYNPNGLISTVKGDARPEQVNQCGGSNTGWLVPDLDFGGCCDDHDRCFDRCPTGIFEGCNSDFKNCMLGTCSNKYSWFWHPVDRFNCEAAAWFYYGVVSSPLGANAFKDATDERCTCNCPSGYANCNNQCTNVSGNDNNNCGACGRQCPSGTHCSNGGCVCNEDTCGNVCTNKLYDFRNCGSCGNNCGTGFYCGGGQCKCALDSCPNGLCTDFTRDPANCGACGNSCDSGICLNGACYIEGPICDAGVNPVIDPGFDIANEGANHCPPGSYYYECDANKGQWNVYFDGSNMGDSSVDLDGSLDSKAASFPNSATFKVQHGYSMSILQDQDWCLTKRYSLTFSVRRLDGGSTPCFVRPAIYDVPAASTYLDASLTAPMQKLGPYVSTEVSTGGRVTIRFQCDDDGTGGFSTFRLDDVQLLGE